MTSRYRKLHHGGRKGAISREGHVVQFCGNVLGAVAIEDTRKRERERERERWIGVMKFESSGEYDISELHALWNNITELLSCRYVTFVEWLAIRLLYSTFWVHDTRPTWWSRTSSLPLTVIRCDYIYIYIYMYIYIYIRYQPRAYFRQSIPSGIEHYYLFISVWFWIGYQMHPCSRFALYVWSIHTNYVDRLTPLLMP